MSSIFLKKDSIFLLTSSAQHDIFVVRYKVR